MHLHLLLLLMLAFQGAAARPGVITGRLRTLEGSPAPRIRVAVVSVPDVNQARETGIVPLQYIPPPAALVSVAMTDDQGRFRLENIPAGRYYVMAGTTDAPTFYPNSKSAQAATVLSVAAGSRRDALNFDLAWPLGIRVEGRVVSSGNIPAALTATLSGSRVDEFLEVPLGSDGTFEFFRVPSGSFTLSLFPPPAGFRPIGVTVVDRDIRGIELGLPPTYTVSGRLATEGDTPLPVGLMTFGASLNYVTAAVAADGTFRALLDAGSHRVDVGGLPVGYRVASVRVGNTAAPGAIIGVDARDVPGVVVTLTASRPFPTVRGRLAGYQPSPGSSPRIELRGRHLYQPLTTAIGADGSFTFPKVLPGLYTISLAGVQGYAPPASLVVTNESIDDLELAPNRGR